MGVQTPVFPNQVWNGVQNTDRESRQEDIDPNYRDYDVISAELISTQLHIINAVPHLITIDTTGLLGQAIYLNINLIPTLAKADSILTADVVGLIYDNHHIQTGGLLTLPMEKWNLVTENGLIPNSTYYLSAEIAGALTLIPPIDSGKILVQIGKAINQFTMLINIQLISL